MGGQLSIGEWAVLGAVAQEPTHGFAVAQLLAPGGDLGRVWTLPRPVVYQALNKLQRLGLVATHSTQRSGLGPTRRIVTATGRGRSAVSRWLVEPVRHVRDLRSEFLLKLALFDRAGAEPSALVAAQRALLATQLATLEADLAAADGFDRVVVQYRIASSRAAIDFIDTVVSH